MPVVARAYWKGFLRLSLVTVNIEIYPAIDTGSDISFRQIHKPTGQRVNAGAKLGQRPGVKVGHRRFEHDKARKPLREGAFVLLPLV